jgi:small-conductance mechanosensitive channel
MFMEDWVVGNLIKTVIIFAIAITTRTLLTRYFKAPSTKLSSQQKLRGLNYTKSFTIIGFFLLTVYIWGEQIQGFAYSVFAIAFAMVFSIKESLTSLNGAFLRWQGHSYEVGDRIAIKDYRGDVIDISLLTTTILEVGKVTTNPLTSGANNNPTGKKIVFPNSLLITETVTNESYLGHYQIMDFSIVLSRKEDWISADKLLHKIVFEECAYFLDQARHKIRQLEKIRAIDLPPIEPKVTVSLSEKEITRFYVRVPAPCNQKEKLEHLITKRFIEEFYQQSKELQSVEAPIENKT